MQVQNTQTSTFCKTNASN